MDGYKTRIADTILNDKLKTHGAVLIEGAKWCGKTTTAEQAAGSCLYMDDPDRSRQYLSMASFEPSRLLEGNTPRLIDEWQLAPRLWDAVRFVVDHRRGLGQFILTGSSVPPSFSEIHHTGTGRFSWMRMRPMSLWESLESTGEVSLRSLFEGCGPIRGSSELDGEGLAHLVCRGGWPLSVEMEGESALEQAFSYRDALVRSDISRFDGVSRSPERARRLLRSYARSQGTQASLSSIVEDVRKSEGESFDEGTARSYLNALEGVFAIEEMPAWNPNLRSKAAIRTSNTRYFVDPSIAAASLELGPRDLLGDLRTFGFLFETMAVRDLRVYADSLKGSVYHFRDKSGLECDAVIHLRSGRYGLVEIKLGGDPSFVEEGAKNLNLLASRIDTTRMKAPSFRMVLVGVGAYAYQRPDGVYVVPIGCLKD